jgi:ferredoxin
MEIRIRRGRCCGSGQCMDSLPRVFMLAPAGKAVVLDSEAASFEVLVEAAADCPCQAIEVDDEDGGEYP